MKTDVKTMTRAQGERAVAATTDLATLKLLGDHKNKHVRAKAAFKYKLIVETAKMADEIVAAADATERGGAS